MMTCRRAERCEGCEWLLRNNQDSYYCELDGEVGIPSDAPSYASLIYSLKKEDFEKKPIPAYCPRILVQEYGRYD